MRRIQLSMTKLAVCIHPFSHVQPNPRMQFSKATLTIVLLLTAIGCVGPSRARHNHGAEDYGDGGRHTWQGDPARIALTAYVPDTSRLGNLSRLQDVSPYTVINESELQCWAAMNSAPARLLLAEGRAITAQASRKQADQAQALNELLELQSIQERNKSASIALQALLRLVEAEGGIGALDKSTGEVDKMLVDVEQLHNLQISSSASALELRERRLKLLHRREEAEVVKGRLNKELGEFLGMDDHALPRIWPEVDLAVTPEVEDVDLAIHVALSTRADLAASYRATHHTAQGTLESARQVLGLAQPGLGVALSGASHLSWRGGSRRDDEADVRAGQMYEMTAELQSTITQEVRVGVAIVRRRLAQIQQTDERLMLLGMRFDELVKMRSVGKATPVEQREARLNIITAENDLLHDVIEWKIAIVKLKEAQGLLAQECGFETAISMCGCSQ